MAIIDDTNFDFAKVGQGTYSPNNYNSDPNNPGGGGFDYSTFGSKNSGGGATTQLLDPSNARRSISGIFPGGETTAEKTAPSIGVQSQTEASGSDATEDDDWRVKLSLPPKSNIFYRNLLLSTDSVLHPLLDTGGVIWPLTPTVSMSHIANYSTQPLTHSNYPARFYQNSEVRDITITGDFPVQSPSDGQYLMAVIYFLRTVTKMFFGSGDNLGNPPPLLFLDGYGTHYLPHVPVVVTSFSHTMPPDVDYIPIPVTSRTVVTKFGSSSISRDTATREVTTGQFNTNGAIQNVTAKVEQGTTTYFGPSEPDTYTTTSQVTRLPTLSQISVTVVPMYSRKNIHERFNLNDFSDGMLLQDKDRGFGGFI